MKYQAIYIRGVFFSPYFHEWITAPCISIFSDLSSYLISSSYSQFLEKENTCLELEMKDLLNELNYQKDHNDLMSEKVAQLEVNLTYSKVFSFL